ncbi:ficolin-3-like [Anopheles nili]|uniref:ficolin-3-like n=1 Tax=Anopheles nili TaxID=185578 RepID=UPI00237C1EBE|nr:ficolin-3-like [Anopheles nili]
MRFGGGWLVIYQHHNHKENFNRSWIEYRNGFGSLDDEFWMGLERQHQLTSLGPYEMLLEVEDFDGNYFYGRYKRFEIGSETEDYMLKKIEYNNGTVEDSVNMQEGLKFLTYDRDTDGQKNFAAQYGEAWWWLISDSYEEQRVQVVFSRMMIREIIE